MTEKKRETACATVFFVPLCNPTMLNFQVFVIIGKLFMCLRRPLS